MGWYLPVSSSLNHHTWLNDPFTMLTKARRILSRSSHSGSTLSDMDPSDPTTTTADNSFPCNESTSNSHVSAGQIVTESCGGTAVPLSSPVASTTLHQQDMMKRNQDWADIEKDRSERLRLYMLDTSPRCLNSLAANHNSVEVSRVTFIPHLLNGESWAKRGLRSQSRSAKSSRPGILIEQSMIQFDSETKATIGRTASGREKIVMSSAIVTVTGDQDRETTTANSQLSEERKQSEAACRPGSEAKGHGSWEQRADKVWERRLV